MPACLVIFGAKLRPDGSAGPALARRVAGALEAASGVADAVFLVTGGQPQAGKTEAAVMRDRLCAAGIEPARILVEDQAYNTRDSALRCGAILRGHSDLTPILVCSDRYHQPRCVWLLRLLGVSAAAAAMPNERHVMRLALWLFSYLREAVAIVYDTIRIKLR